MFNRSACIAAAAVAAASLAPASSGAEELRIAVGLAGDGGLVKGMEKFAENLEANTDGEFTGKVYPSTLLNFAESMTGLRDGIADAAFVVPAYHRAEFPNTNLVGDMSTASTDPVVMGGAVNEFMMSCEACLKEYSDQGQVFMGMTVTGPYYLMSVDKVETLDDFEGKKFRGFGPFGRWVAAMGAQPVVLSANDIYESISQGQIDGNTHIVEVLKSLSLGEVTDYLLNEPIGLFPGNSMFNVSKMVWDDLSDENKRAFLLSGGGAAAWTTVTYLAENQAYLEDPGSVGVELVEPSEEISKASAEFRKADLETVAQENVEKHGIPDAAEQIERMRGLVEKWEKLVAEIDDEDPQAVADLYNREIFSKVDLSKLD